MPATLKSVPFFFLAVAILAAIVGCRTTGQWVVFGDWPAGASPQEVGKRVAENFAGRQFDFEINARRRYVTYPEVCAWYGSLTVARLTGDDDLKTRLIKRFDPLLASGLKRISQKAHVDDRLFGVVPLEIYVQTQDKKYLELGKSFADKQWENPTADGITREARYWVDDIYMISAVQVQAFRATGDRTYLDRAARAAAAYIAKLQQPTGLFFHATDSPLFWSRGNGWSAAGMTELLSELPADHPRRAHVMDGYRKMMAALLNHQTDEGLWRQLIDKPESWLESSGTGMFAFAMVTGVKRGWLDARTYGPAARQAWVGLVQRLDKDANVKETSVGTNKAFNVVGADPAMQLKYYLDRERKTGDLHGQAPILWTASALMRSDGALE